jgi:chromosome segregation ATPase
MQGLILSDLQNQQSVSAADLATAQSSFNAQEARMNSLASSVQRQKQHVSVLRGQISEQRQILDAQLARLAKAQQLVHDLTASISLQTQELASIQQNDQLVTSMIDGLSKECAALQQAAAQDSLASNQIFRVLKDQLGQLRSSFSDADSTATNQLLLQSTEIAKFAEQFAFLLQGLNQLQTQNSSLSHQLSEKQTSYVTIAIFCNILPSISCFFFQSEQFAD